MSASKDFGGVAPSNITAGPWISRDAYVAETAVCIDRLVAKVERLERRGEALDQRVLDLTDHAEQASRFQALAESLRNSRDYKVGEVMRQIKELRGRLDVIEGPRGEYGGLAYRSLADIDRKLGDLSVLELRAAALARRLHAFQFLAGFLLATVCALVAGAPF